MALVLIFVLSGAGIITLTLAKRFQEKKKKNVFILRAISRGNERVHDYHHRAINTYSVGKERMDFWVRKQLPLRTKNIWYKMVAYIQERGNEYIGEMRNVKLLKRTDGLSEFFKNISEIEKGTGEINDSYTEPTPTVVTSIPVTPMIKVSKPRAPKKRKLVVIETE